MATGKKVTLTIQQRLDVLQDLETLPVAMIAKKYKVHPMTIRRIRNNASSIAPFANKDKQCKRRQRLRKPVYEQLEKELQMWFIQKKTRGDFISDTLLMNKAKEIKNTMASCSNFKVSKGWLLKFKRRYNIRLHQVVRDEKGTTDKDAATTFATDFQKLLVEEHVNLENIYNMNETGLLWKALPTKTLAEESEKDISGYKLKKERITVALCANATGTHKLEPLIIYKYKKPRALKSDLEKLPVIFKSQKNACLDQSLFIDWYENHFKTSVLRYQSEKGIVGKIILLIDNCTGYKILNTVENEFFKIIYLPPNTTSLIQPMDQGIIEKVKRCFRHTMMKKAIEYEEGIQEFYEYYNIKDCIDMLFDAWQNITGSDLIDAWNKIIIQPTIKKETGEEDGEENLINNLVGVMSTISERNISKEDVTKFLHCCSEAERENLIKEEDVEIESKSEEENEETRENDTRTERKRKEHGVFYNESERIDLEDIFRRLEWYSSRIEPSIQLILDGLKLKYLGGQKK